MDYGPSLMATYEISKGDGSNIVNKGIAIRLDPGPGGVSRGRAWAVYDQDTMRFAAAWTGQGFIDWHGINFNGSHQVHPRLAGRVELSNPNEPALGQPRRLAVSSTSASGAAMASIMVLCRGAGSITGGCTSTPTG